MKVLDLFSAAAGGWSLGMHRAGFTTIAACEVIDWRRALYAQNNPGVLIYEDVTTLTADRIRADLGTLPDIVVGSPPCQDISSANTKGKGVDGERSGLYFEAVRLVGECRPRWFAFENSANLRTRGADRVLGALEALGYACWAFVVGADDVGANHERKRSWIIGCDVAQLADADHQSVWRAEQPRPEGQGRDLPGLGAAAGDCGRGDGARPLPGRHGGLGEVADASRGGCGAWAGDHQGADAGLNGCLAGHDHGDGSTGDASQDGRGPGLSGRRAGAATGPEQPPCRDDVDAAGLGHEGGRSRRHGPDGDGAASVAGGGLGPSAGQVGLCTADRSALDGSGSHWSLANLADCILLDAGLSAWTSGARIAVGGPRGTSAASLIVEAFGDSVLPQIPEAIGRAILRTEAALLAVT